MTRELQFKVSGMIFYIVLVLILGTSRAGWQFLSNVFSQSHQTDSYQVIAAAVGAGAVVFTSDAMGFIFSTIAFFCWNRGRKLSRWWSAESSYSLDWENHSTLKWKDRIVNRYTEALNASMKHGRADPSELGHDRFEQQLTGCSTDVLISYFWELAPERIAEWTTRRYNAFHAHRSAITAIVLGVLIGAFCAMYWRMGITTAHGVIVVFLAGLVAVLYSGAERSIREARQITELWLTRAADPVLEQVFSELERKMSVASGSCGDDASQ